MFDQVADTYDNVGVDFFKPIAERLVRELAPRPGERALDAGCGRGAALFPLTREVGPGNVVALDLAPRMVAATAADAAEAGVVVEVCVGDVQAPDLPLESFDIITSSLVLFFLSDPLSALRAWRALLVPGGRVGVSTFGERSEAWRTLDEVFAPYLPEQMVDPRTRGDESPFASDAGLETLMADAGLVDVRTTTMVVPVRFTDEDHWYRWTWSVGQRQMWEAVPADRREAVRTAAYERLAASRDEQGIISFDQTARFTLGRRGS